MKYTKIIIGTLAVLIVGLFAVIKTEYGRDKLYSFRINQLSKRSIEARTSLGHVVTAHTRVKTKKFTYTIGDLLILKYIVGTERPNSLEEVGEHIQKLDKWTRRDMATNMYIRRLADGYPKYSKEEFHYRGTSFKTVTTYSIDDTGIITNMITLVEDKELIHLVILLEMKGIDIGGKNGGYES